MNEREKLGKEILFIIKDGYLSNGSKGYVVHGNMEILSDRLTDFILADRKRILLEIKSRLEPVSKMSNDEIKAFYGSVRYVAKTCLEIIKNYEGMYDRQ